MLVGTRDRCRRGGGGQTGQPGQGNAGLMQACNIYFGFIDVRNKIRVV